MLILNPRAQRQSYPAELAAVMNMARAEESGRWLSSWQGISPQPTPLYSLPDAADRLRVAGLSVKDESVRSSLGSFKALGAPIALVRQVLRLHPSFEPADLLKGCYARELASYTVISATDGNHGDDGDRHRPAAHLAKRGLHARMWARRAHGHAAGRRADSHAPPRL